MDAKLETDCKCPIFLLDLHSCHTMFFNDTDALFVLLKLTPKKNVFAWICFGLTQLQNIVKGQSWPRPSLDLYISWNTRGREYRREVKGGDLSLLATLLFPLTAEADPIKLKCWEKSVGAKKRGVNYLSSFLHCQPLLPSPPFLNKIMVWFKGLEDRFLTMGYSSGQDLLIF